MSGSAPQISPDKKYNIDDFPIVVAKHCSLRVLGNGRLELTSYEIASDDDLKNANLVSLVFNNPWLYHYFHFMEFVIAEECLREYFFPQASIDKIYIGGQMWNDAGASAQILNTILKPNLLVGIDNHQDNAECDIAVVMDMMDSAKRQWNKYLEPFEDLAISLGRRSLSRLQQCAPKMPKTAEATALYIHRKPPRHLDDWLKAKLFRHAARAGFAIEEVDFGALSFQEQMAKAASSDLLIGIHGNGLTNCLWLDPGCAVIEIFPPGCHHYDYQYFSEFSGLKYFGIEARRERAFFYTNRSRVAAAYGEVNTPIIADLPWGSLDRALRHCFPTKKRPAASMPEESNVNTENLSVINQRKSFSQFGEDGVIEWYFHGREAGFYVDVGCHHPFRLSNTALLHLKGWNGINIDVDERAIFAFRELRPDDINVCIGIGDRIGEMEVTLFDDGALNTFDADWAAHPAWAHIGRTQKTVHVRPLHEVLKSHLPEGQDIGFMNVDTEHLDMEVLQSNNWILYRPELVAVETDDLDLTQALAHPVIAFMVEVGYQFIAHVVSTSFFKRR